MERKFPFLVFLLLVTFSQTTVLADGKIQQSSDRLIAGEPPRIEEEVYYKKVIDCSGTYKVPGHFWVEEGNNVRAYGPLFMGSTYVRPSKTWSIGVTRWGCQDIWVEIDDIDDPVTEENDHE